MSYLHEYPDATLQEFLTNEVGSFGDLCYEMGRRVMREESALTHKEREMMAAFCLALQGVQQPLNVHSRCYALLGGDHWRIQDLVKDDQHRAACEKLRPLLQIVRKLTGKTGSVCHADIDECYAVGWDGEAINRTIVLTGFFNMMARWNSGAGMKYTAEEIVMASDGLTDYGYNGEGAGLNDEAYKQASGR